MKKAILKHDNIKGFILIDEEENFITKIGVGNNDEEPDWYQIEAQANEIGYTLY